MMKKLLLLSLLLGCLFLSSAYSQPWVEKLMSNERTNFYDIQREFYNYIDTTEDAEKRGGYKQFKRWEWFWEQRVHPDGIFPDPMHLWTEYQKLTASEEKNKKDIPQSTWNFRGPTSSTGGYAGLGRVNCVRSDPNNPNILWAGTPSGGLWKSTNSGSSWQIITNDLLSLGVTDIVINPSNSNIMYIATGDGMNGDTYSVGVLKSTNGGATWNTTGLNWSVTLTRRISRLIIHPTAYSVIYAATSNGIYKTDDAGATWTRLIAGNFKDIEFKPNNPSTLYAATTRIYKSTNDGNNWTELTDNLPTTGVNRISLAVTPADSEYVYALASSSNSTFYGLYRSTNSGENWTRMSNTPNILGRAVDGNDNVGQGWYDLCMAVSQTNRNVVLCGGINTWRSTDGGSTWQIVSMWYNYGSIPTIHADQHDMFYIPNTNILYVGNDGGVYRTTNSGTSWTWLGNSMGITQFYKLGVSQQNANNVIAGCQDNGTKYQYNNSWYDVYGGDGMECFIDYTNENYVYATTQNGNLLRSTNGGNSFSGITPSGQTGAWVTPYLMHPSMPTTIFAGFKNVYKSTNRGSSWSVISDFGSSRNLTFLHIAPANPDYIYAYDGQTFRLTKNGGANWITLTLPTTRTMTYLISHPNNPEKIWASFSGYTSGEKVYTSDNSGVAWSNISYNLPNIPAKSLEILPEDNDKIFVGTDLGVFFIDKTLSQWQSFNEGLPNVIITELELHKSSKILFASSYGRGVWSRQLPTIPAITMQSLPSSLCLGQSFSINFDVSDNFNPGNKFILQLSDRYGNFDNPTKIGELVSANGGIINGYIPYSSIPDTRYKLRIVSNDPETFVISNTSITVYPLPDMSIYGSSFICAGTKTDYSCVPEPDGTYLWTVLQGGTIVGGNNQRDVIVQWSKDQTAGILQLIKQNSYGCKDTNNIEVTISPLPQKMEISGDLSVCLNSVSIYSVPVENGTSCQWTVTKGEVIDKSLNHTIYVKWNEIGKSKIKLIRLISATACRDSAEITVNVHSSPNMMISGNNKLCANKIGIFSVTPDTNVSNKWIAVGGEIENEDYADFVAVKWQEPGQSILTLIRQDTVSFCADTVSYNIEVSPLPNTFINGLFNVVVNKEYQYSVQEMPDIKYKWLVEGGELLTADNIASIKVIWKNPELANLTLIAEDKTSNCADTNSKKINIFSINEIHIEGQHNACLGDILEYYTDDNDKYHYRWKTENADIVGNNNSYKVSVEFTKLGISNIRLIRELVSTGDIDSATIQIDVFGVPELKISFFGKEKLCPDDSVVLDAGDHYQYEWSDGSSERRLVVIDEGFYSVIVKNEAGCFAQEEIFVEKAELEIPELIRRGDSLICRSDAIQYIWYKNGELVPEENKFYVIVDNIEVANWQVAIIDINGCYSISNVIITSIEDLSSLSKDIRIIPNPAFDAIQIILNNENYKNAVLTIVDLLGKTYYTERINQNYNSNINISEYPSGLYFVRISSANGAVVRKFVKL